MTITSTIELLRKIVLDKNCDHMNKSTVVGYLGELIVKNQLELCGFNVDHKGNQTGYDLLIKNGDVKIDVKTSRLKIEFSRDVRNWGWALVHSNKQKQISATHFICLAFNDDLSINQMILIPADVAIKFPQGIGQFPGVINGLVILPDGGSVNKLTIKQIEYLNECKKRLRNKSIRIIKTGEKFTGEDFIGGQH